MVPRSSQPPVGKCAAVVVTYTHWDFSKTTNSLSSIGTELDSWRLQHWTRWLHHLPHLFCDDLHWRTGVHLHGHFLAIHSYVENNWRNPTTAQVEEHVSVFRQIFSTLNNICVLQMVPHLTPTNLCQVPLLTPCETLSILKWANPWPMRTSTLETHLPDWQTLHLVNGASLLPLRFHSDWLFMTCLLQIKSIPRSHFMGLANVKSALEGKVFLWQ